MGTIAVTNGTAGQPAAPAAPVVVVGGGIAGLATAYELARRRVPFTLLERAARAGGVVLSEERDGFTIDAGPDSLLVQKPEAIRLCEELGLGARLVPTLPPRLSYILRSRTLHPLPASSVLGIPTRLGPFARSRLFSLSGKLRMGAELFVPRRHPGAADESIGGFIRRRFGAEAATYLAEPLLAGIHAGDVDRLSVRALFPRFAEAEAEHGSLIRAFRASRRDDTRSDGPFRSLPGGLSEMIRAIEAALPAGSLRLNTPVRTVSAEAAGGFRVEAETGEILRVPALVLATPAWATADLVKDLAPPLARLCREIRYTSTATIALAFARDSIDHALNGTGFVVPGAERIGILAASWLSSKWPHRAPGTHALIRAFVGGARDPQALDRPDEELTRLAVAAMTPLLGIRRPPVWSHVYRWPRANAQHEVGHLVRLAAVEDELEKHQGLFVTGSGFRGVGIPDCVADGRKTAARVADWLATVPAPRPAPGGPTVPRALEAR